jgi:hypothetical protein
VGDSTFTPAQYVARVFSRLQGLTSCDGIENNASLSTEQQVAVRVLGQVCANYCVPGCAWLVNRWAMKQIVGVHANALSRVDLSELNIAHSAYFKLMAPLSLLPVRGIDMRGGKGYPPPLFPSCTAFLLLFLQATLALTTSMATKPATNC